MACSLSSSSLSEVTHGMMEDNPMSGVYCKPGKGVGESSGLLEEHLTVIPSPSKVHGFGGSSLGNSVKLLFSFLIKKL